MRVYKHLIDNNLSFDKIFTITELQDIPSLYFRHIDFLYIIQTNLFFVNHNNNTYYLNPRLFQDFQAIKNNYINKHNFNIIKTNFLNAYEQIKEAIKKENYSEMNIIVNSQLNNAYALYGMSLVEFPEYMIENSGLYPSNINFFNHIHMIEDLAELLSKPITYSKKGDINLYQEMSFKIYTDRWKHFDNYKIKRSFDGWIFYGLMNNLTELNNTNCNKDGTGALIQALEHDSVNYPKSLSFALEHLWERADEDNMSINELNKYIEDLAEWISKIESSKPKFLSDMAIM
ncbi:hypothetical protein, partial [Aliarcobacter butzleri]|uniref:hypothetical protein n=1 Tax=Aliarcobacter butzleri TaxID=28197 RepID=UPI00263E9192